MQRTPKVISSQTVYKNAFQEIKLDTLELNGKRWEQVYFVKPYKNCAGILPVDEKGMYLVKQYRHASQALLWQIPMGMLDKHETERETAEKELREEAGISAKKFIKLGAFFAEPGMSNQEMHVFVATGLAMHEQHLDVSEQDMRVKHFTFEEINKMVKSEEIHCGFTLSALALYKYKYL